MSKFVHMSDIHLGAHREPSLRDLERKCFGEAVDACIREDVDFLLISGDLFHVGIPDLGVVNDAVKKMRELRDSRIPIYAIYGSHDYTPTGTSVIDILHTAGVLTNIMQASKEEGGRLRLKMFVDPETGAKLTGIAARKVGLESRHYEALDKEALEQERGFKVFAFHSGITQFKPDYLSEMETIEITSLPKGFDYYAGGHIHQRGEYSAPGYAKVVFPGPLFTGYGGKDIESTVRGEKRGFYVVDFDDRLRSARFVPVETFEGTYLEVDAGGRNAAEVNKELQERGGRLEVGGRVVVVKVFGELAGGKAGEVDVHAARKEMGARGALSVYVNRNGLKSREEVQVKVAGEDAAAIERNLFSANVARLRLSTKELTGASGAEHALELLRLTRQGQKSNEMKKDYSKRVVEAAAQAILARDVLEERVE
ncbi:MAG: exonuclease SbcCD subunit D [Nitrososphaerota archaeon]|nr:exonuclease SbcCD subunit D [Nitrososphaerota archaeon]MDG7021848.1 exonuclease SbcCD subunit D [Nitrososphaerota archaeon]